MSRRPRNNHYHYAEQYSDGHYRRKQKAASVMHLPPRAVFFALLVLLVFGIVTTTFSANTSADDPESRSILVSVRSAKANRDLALTGAEVDLARSGYRFQGAPFYFIAPSDWDLTKGVSVMCDGDKGWTETYASNMTRIGNSRIFYHSGNVGTHNDDQNRSINFNNNDWFCFINEKDWGFGWGDQNRRTYASKYTTCNTSWNVSDGKAVFTATLKSGKEYTLSGTYYSDANFPGSHSYNQTYKMQYKVGSGSYTDATSTYIPGTATLATSYWNHTGTDAYKSGGTATKTIYNDGISDYVFEYGVKTAPVALTASAGSGFVLDGIFKSDDLENRVDSTTAGSASYTISGASTYYARFHADNYTITYNLTGGKTVDNNGQNAETTPNDADVDWASGYTAPGSRNYTESVTLPTASNVTASGRIFLGWYNNADCTGSAVTTIPATQASDVTLYAKWKWQHFTITYNSDASPATAAAGTITNPNSVPTSATKLYGASYSITDKKFSRPGYTQVGWSTSANSTSSSGAGFYGFNASYSTNANLTLYPVWELNTPTNTDPETYALDPDDPYPDQPKIITTDTMTVGGSPVNLSLDLEGGNGAAYSTNSNISLYYSYTITGPTGNHASVGTDPANSATFMKFTADIPGTYEVTITVDAYSATGVTNPYDADITNSSDARYHKGYATADTNTAIISVAPDAPQFEITVYGVVDDPERDGSSGQGKAYMVMLGNRYYFSAAINDAYLLQHPVSDYTYEWAWDSDFAHKIDTDIDDDGDQDNLPTITFIDKGDVSVPNYELIDYDPGITYDPEDDPRTLAEESDGVYHSVSLFCRVTCNEVSNDSLLKQKWYFIQPLIKSFVYEPMQKIFNLNDQTVSLAAEYNVSDDPEYSSKLYFSHTNSNVFDDWAEAASASGFIHSFASAIRTYLYPAGPKYFYLLMTGYNSQDELIESRSEKVHTTVDTVDSIAMRSLYFDNTVANMSLKNYLVMCYYIDGSGNLCYQKAQDLRLDDDVIVDGEVVDTNSDDGRHYRVMIPEDAVAVRLGFLSSDVEGKYYYGEPTLTAGVIGGFTGPTYYGYSEQITLTESTCVITLNNVRDVTLHELYYDSAL